MFFISVKKHNQIVNDLRTDYIQKIKSLEKENETKRWSWLKEKNSYIRNLEKENKSLKDSQQTLSEDNVALRLEFGLLKDDYENVKNELRLSKRSIGGLKSSITQKNKKILTLQEEVHIAKNGGFKVRKIRSPKNPKMETSRIIKGPRNSQVNKILKELGDHND